MAKKSIAKKRQKRNRKKWVVSSQVPLCALGKVLRSKSVFQHLHRCVNIPQKTVVYRPTDKLVFVVLGMLSGAENVSEINTKVRPGPCVIRGVWVSKVCGCLSDPTDVRCDDRSHRVRT